MKKKGFSNADIAGALERLAHEGLIDDDVFAQKFTAEMLRRKPVGRLYIAAKLRQRGIEKDSIDKTIATYATDEREHAVAKKAIQQWQRMHAGSSINEPKLARFLAGRGFLYATIVACIGELRREEG